MDSVFYSEQLDDCTVGASWGFSVSRFTTLTWLYILCMVRCFKNEVKYACKSRRPKSSYVRYARQPDGKKQTLQTMHDLWPVLPVSISKQPLTVSYCKTSWFNFTRALITCTTCALAVWARAYMCVHVWMFRQACSFSLSNEGLRHCLSERDVSCHNLLIHASQLYILSWLLVAPCIVHRYSFLFV